MNVIQLINEEIIREYDIRGVFDTNLTLYDAYLVGSSFGSYLQLKFNKKDICISRDFRVSSIQLEQELIKGLINSGCNVYQLGENPTPVLYYSVMRWNFTAGIMVTGSHNVLEINGFKFFINGHIPFYGKEIKKLNTIPIKEGCGTLALLNVVDDYLATLLKQINTPNKFKILWACMSNTTFEVITELCKYLSGVNIVVEYLGKYSPDPTLKRNITPIIKSVRKQKYDFAFIFDGDGDRLVIINKKGKPIAADKLLYIFAQDLKTRYHSPIVIADVKCSNWIISRILQLGIKVVVTKTGHALVRHALNNSSALIAVEYSGHIFFKENYFGFDDGIYAAIRFLNIIGKFTSNLNDLLFPIFPKIFTTPEIRVECNKHIAQQIIEKMERIIIKAQICKIDGIKIITDGYWFLIRKSNTENNIIIKFEARTKKEFIMVKKFLLMFLNKYNLSF